MSFPDYFDRLSHHNPPAAAMWSSSDLSSFHRAVEQFYQRELRLLEDARSVWQSATEPQLSHHLAHAFGEHTRAKPEEYVNGKVDIVVYHPRMPELRHLTECKKWKGLAWHLQGMEQVCGYATHTDPRALVVEFFWDRQTTTKDLFDGLRADLVAQTGVWKPRGPIQNLSWLSLAFVTKHAHRSGFDIEIVHACCDLQ